MLAVSICTEYTMFFKKNSWHVIVSSVGYLVFRDAQYVCYSNYMNSFKATYPKPLGTVGGSYGGHEHIGLSLEK